MKVLTLVPLAQGIASAILVAYLCLSVPAARISKDTKDKFNNLIHENVQDKNSREMLAGIFKVMQNSLEVASVLMTIASLGLTVASVTGFFTFQKMNRIVNDAK